MEEKMKVLDDSFDGLDEKNKEGIMEELRNLTLDELKEEAKKEGIENYENLTREEILEEFEEVLED